MLSPKIHDAYRAILREELVPAMGCTEPIAIAYCAAILRHVLGRVPTSVNAGCSGNIIKNVKSVIVPATGGKHGIEAAIAAGLISGRPELKLEVLTALGNDANAKIDELLTACNVKIEEISDGCVFELRLTGRADGHVATVTISGSHTNVTEVRLDGENLTDDYASCAATEDSSPGADRGLLTVERIVEYAGECDIESVASLLERQIELNMAIAEEGLRGEWGASIGRIMLSTGGDVIRKARAYAAAGSDARMSGCEMPVCIISGSGNQGITTSVPVVIYAKEMGASREELLRALVCADLITIHQKTGIGCLSAYCGAISAGVGAGAGICYLRGGDFRMIAHTIVNAVAILSGTICDGAKPSCAAKIAMAVEAGILGYEMAEANKQFYGGDGIVVKGVENTIRNVGRLAKDGMSETDREIIKMMLGE